MDFLGNCEFKNLYFETRGTGGFAERAVLQRRQQIPRNFLFLVQVDFFDDLEDAAFEKMSDVADEDVNRIFARRRVCWEFFDPLKQKKCRGYFQNRKKH